MVFKNGVKNIQAASYNNVRTVHSTHKYMKNSLFVSMVKIETVPKIIILGLKMMVKRGLEMHTYLKKSTTVSLSSKYLL